MQRPPNDYDLLPLLQGHYRAAITKRIGPTDPATGCVKWIGAFTYRGYGTYTIAGDRPYTWRSVRAHRAVFMLHHGRPIATDMTLHHKCHTPACVNPDHLVELSQADNNAADATGGGSIRFRQTKRGVPRWAVLFREDGKQRSRTFGSIEAAEEFADSRKVGAA